MSAGSARRLLREMRYTLRQEEPPPHDAEIEDHLRFISARLLLVLLTVRFWLLVLALAALSVVIE